MENRLPPFERHVFVCHNTRPEGAPRPSCTRDGKSDLHTELQQRVKAAGLSGKVRINKSGCLDQCEHGPMVVVYPDAVWYGNVRSEDAAGDCGRAPGGGTAGGAATRGRRVPEHRDLPASGMKAPGAGDRVGPFIRRRRNNSFWSTVRDDEPGVFSSVGSQSTE